MNKHEEAKKVMAQMTPTVIKGKPYYEVHQRIEVFRQCYPEGSIVTKMVSNENGVCIFKATIYDCGRVIATGHAYEKEGSTFINTTSYIENAETSAIGRAIGTLGIGIDGSVASAMEVANAIKNQNRTPADLPKEEKDKLLDKISEKDAKILVEFAKSVGYGKTNKEASAKLCEYFDVKRLSEVTNAQRAKFIKDFNNG